VALCPFSRYTSTFEGMIETSILDGSIGNMVYMCVSWSLAYWFNFFLKKKCFCGSNEKHRNCRKLYIEFPTVSMF